MKYRILSFTLDKITFLDKGMGIVFIVFFQLAQTILEMKQITWNVLNVKMKLH